MEGSYMPHYVILTKPNCPWCEKAKQLLTENDLKFTEYNVEEYPMFKDMLYSLDMKTVPQIITKNYWIGGYAALEDAFAYTDY